MTVLIIENLKSLDMLLSGFVDPLSLPTVMVRVMYAIETMTLLRFVLFILVEKAWKQNGVLKMIVSFTQ